MRHQKHPVPPMNQQPPHSPREERRRRKEEHRRQKERDRELHRARHRSRFWRRFSVVLVILLALVIILLLLCMLFDINPFTGEQGGGNGLFGDVFGLGKGGTTPAIEINKGGDIDEPAPTAVVDIYGDTKDNLPEIIIIKIDNDKIYLGEELCADTNDLKEKIIRQNYSEHKYQVDSRTAAVKTYDGVISTLENLINALGIEVLEEIR